MKKFELIDKSFPKIMHGGDYNPEQWMDTKKIWDEDMRLMKKAHCNEMTVGIFSWAEIEKEEGVFDFSWLDEIIDRVYSAGGRVILATPSAARPRWMAEKYPEVMRVWQNGTRLHFRDRHNHCYTSPVYREKVRIIDELIAKRYGNNPAVAAWHISNEFNGACYCPLCAEKFKEWVHARYGNDINKLNHAWWARFWSHRYNSFDEVEPPFDSGERRTMGLNLDWRRFVSDMTVDFAKNEADVIRKYSDKPITTNCMCEYAGYDHYKMAEILDRTSYDFYPQWHRNLSGEALRTAYLGALYRGMKGGRPFMIMESAPGINAGGMTFGKLKSTKTQIMEAIGCVANGADMIGYFQWRKGRGGLEKIHGAVVDHYGKEDSRVFETVTKVGEILEKIAPVAGCGIKSEVAITHDYETGWALDGEADITWGIIKNGYESTSKAFFNAFMRKNIPADIIPYSEDFSKYKVICLNVPYLMDEALAEKIKDYVKNGGILISTYFTAVADKSDLCHLGGVPALGLSEVFGLRVDEQDSYESIPGRNSVNYKGKSYPLSLIAEVIKPSGAEALAEYESDYYKGTPAVTKHAYGKGTAYYIGFTPEYGFMEEFIADVAKEHSVLPTEGITAENGVHITLREGDGEKYYFAVNYTDEEKKCTLSKALYNMADEKTESGEIVIEPRGVKIYSEK